MKKNYIIRPMVIDNNRVHFLNMMGPTRLHVNLTEEQPVLIGDIGGVDVLSKYIRHDDIIGAAIKLIFDSRKQVEVIGVRPTVAVYPIVDDGSAGYKLHVLNDTRWLSQEVGDVHGNYGQHVPYVAGEHSFTMAINSKCLMVKPVMLSGKLPKAPMGVFLEYLVSV